MRPHVAIGLECSSLAVLVAPASAPRRCTWSRRRCDARPERCARRRYLRFGRILWHLPWLPRQRILFRLSISGTHRRDTQREELGLGTVRVKVKDDLNRVDVSVGYLFLRKRSARPFVHAGVSRVNAQDIEANVEFLES